AQARRAVAGGAEFREFTRVVDLVRDGGTVAGVVVENSLDPQGTETIAADVVVAAGGLWGPTLGRLAGVELPVLPVEHCFATTAPVPSLAGANDELDEASKPLLRHQDFALYLREYNDR
ncbi:FAD-dependent oxidoreductase, partial [Arthrobacter deserti]|nr:FAD-dependent oxidoreductase [Arthrobacter deserti]